MFQIRNAMATVALMAATGCGAADEPATVPTDPTALGSELVRRSDAFQAARLELMRAASTREGGAEVERSRAKLQRMEQENLAWLKDAVALHGWPKRSQVGPEGAQAAWLLIQHSESDVSFQARVLELLSAAARAGEASWRSVAYLNDRVLVSQGRPQRFGTQLDLSSGSPVPYPIDDTSRVDARRAQSGLPPMAEYLEQVRDQLAAQRVPVP